MPGTAQSDVVQIFTLICGVVTALGMGLGVPALAYLMAKLKDKQTSLHEINARQDEKLQVLSDKVEDMHKAVVPSPATGPLPQVAPPQVPQPAPLPPTQPLPPPEPPS